VLILEVFAVTLQISEFCTLPVTMFWISYMNAFVNLALSIVLFHLRVVTALDVRIETIEDDGTRDEWTFEDASLKSELHVNGSKVNS